MASVIDQLGVVIERHIKGRGVGTFTPPGLLKIEVVRKPATKFRLRYGMLAAAVPGAQLLSTFTFDTRNFIFGSPSLGEG